MGMLSAVSLLSALDPTTRPYKSYSLIYDGALRTGRKVFIDTCRGLSDKFLSLLSESGVPLWLVHLVLSSLLPPIPPFHTDPS